jgi:pimeloyl-ACP methyl ester carboxylesterase
VRLPLLHPALAWRNRLCGVAVYAADLADRFHDGTVPSIDNAGVPVIIITGDRDGLADPRYAVRTFERVRQPPAAFVSVRGGNHFSINDADNIPGTPNDPNAATLEQVVAIETIARWAGTLLRAYALGDADAYAYVTALGPPADQNVELLFRQ